MSDLRGRLETPRKRTHDQDKTTYAAEQHRKAEQSERQAGNRGAYDVPDNAKRVGQDTNQPHYYTTGSESSSVQKTLDVFKTTFDEGRTDYPKQSPLTDMSKSPLFFGKPGQYDTVTTWCDITFLTNDELSQDKAKQAATFASLFRGPVLTWLGKHPEKDTLLRNYPRLCEEVKKVWDRSDTIKRADAARRLTTISQRKSVRGYTLEFNGYADLLGWDGTAKQAMYVRGLKQHVREALVASDSYSDYKELTEEAERIDDELFSVRRSRPGNFGRGGGHTGRSFPGKCNSCGQIGHKARDCKRGKKDDNW